MRSPSVLRKLGVSVLSLFVIFAILELAARATEPGPFSLRDRNPYMPFEGLHHVHRPNFEGRWDGTWYSTNTLMMRGAELPPYHEGQYRVVALGDSCTFGKGVLESECWPRQLETLLEGELLPDTTPVVANLGVNGYSSGDYRVIFDNVGADLEPELVIIGFNLNDFPNAVMQVDQTVFQGKTNLRSKIPGGLRNKLGSLALYRWMRATYYEANEARDRANAEKLASEIGSDDPTQRDRLDRARAELEQLIGRAREVGAHVLLFLFPYESQVYQDAFDDSAVQWIRNVCEDNDVPFVDMLTPYRELARQADAPDLFLRGDRYHPTAEGYTIVAEELLEVLRAQGWLPTRED